MGGLGATGAVGGGWAGNGCGLWFVVRMPDCLDFVDKYSSGRSVVGNCSSCEFCLSFSELWRIWKCGYLASDFSMMDYDVIEEVDLIKVILCPRDDSVFVNAYLSVQTYILSPRSSLLDALYRD